MNTLLFINIYIYFNFTLKNHACKVKKEHFRNRKIKSACLKEFKSTVFMHVQPGFVIMNMIFYAGGVQINK